MGNTPLRQLVLVVVSLLSCLFGAVLTVFVGDWLDQREIKRDVLRRLAGNRYAFVDSCLPVQSNPEVGPTVRSYSTNAKGNFQFDRVISGWRDRPVLDLRLKR